MNEIANLLLSAIVDKKAAETGRFSDGYCAALVAIREIRTEIDVTRDATPEEAAWLAAAKSEYKKKFDAAYGA